MQAPVPRAAASVSAGIPCIHCAYGPPASRRRPLLSDLQADGRRHRKVPVTGVRRALSHSALVRACVELLMWAGQSCLEPYSRER